MTVPVQHIIYKNTFWLSPQRCIFWQEEEALIVSDLHFGKTGHFRKNGIAVPADLYKEDLQRLVEQIAYFKPKKIIAVGDLFHSEANKELNLFLKWRNDLAAIDFILVRGNHDILNNNWYLEAGITVKEGLYTLQNFGFVHDPAEVAPETMMADFIFSGHLHPGISIKGLGKQSLQFPCYYFTDSQAILPAFSKFSGLALVKAKKPDKVFAIVDEKVILI
jgi:DNA ligase-associated metallophosphoesterase